MANIASEPCTEAKLRNPESPASNSRQASPRRPRSRRGNRNRPDACPTGRGARARDRVPVAAFRPRTIRQRSAGRGRARRRAPSRDQALLIVEETRDVNEINRVRCTAARRSRRAAQRFKTRASLSKSASDERSNWSSNRRQSRRPSVSESIASTAVLEQRLLAFARQVRSRACRRRLRFECARRFVPRERPRRESRECRGATPRFSPASAARANA